MFVRITARWWHTLRRFFTEWSLTVAVGVAALLACAKIGEDVFSHETGTFDGVIQRWVEAHQNPGIAYVFLAITYAGSVGVTLATALAAAVWLWRERGRRVAASSLVAPAVATALFIGIKRLFARARPPAIGHLVLGTYAFPSGHATASTAVWCTLAYISWREGLASRRQAIWIAALLPLLVGLSRLYLDVHWATDVLGGWSLGLLIAVMGIALYDRGRRRHATLDQPPHADVAPSATTA
jgi:undecaprenyl-diphosphatase